MTMKRTLLALMIGGALLWALPVRAAYINWTGENFIYPASGNATAGCATGAGVAHCYASFPDGSTTWGILRATVPQDMPYSPNAPRLKCNVTGYSPDGGAGTAIFQYIVNTFPAGAEPSPTSGGTATLGFAATTTGSNAYTSSAYASFMTLYDQASNASCTTNATCVGVPLEIGILRAGGDGSDNLGGAFRVTNVTCEY